MTTTTARQQLQGIADQDGDRMRRGTASISRGGEYEGINIPCSVTWLERSHGLNGQPYL